MGEIPIQSKPRVKNRWISKITPDYNVLTITSFHLGSGGLQGYELGIEKTVMDFGGKVIFGVTVANVEIDFLNNEEVSEEKESGWIGKSTMPDLNM